MPSSCEGNEIDPRPGKASRRNAFLSCAVALTLATSMVPLPAVAETDAGATTESGQAQEAGASSTAGESASTQTSASSESSSTESADCADSATTPSSDAAAQASSSSSSSAAVSANARGGASTSASAGDSASEVTVTYSNRFSRGVYGAFASGFDATVSAKAGDTITLPTASDITLTGSRASTLIGWSTSSTSTTAGYAPGASYTVPDSDVTLYPVWQQTMTLAPTLTHMQAYYTVTDQNSKVLEEGELNGSATIVVPGPEFGENFVNVFVKADDNYLLTRVDSKDINNFIYPLSGTYYGRPAKYVSASVIQSMRDAGYVATFGWGLAYHKDGDALSVDAAAEQPTPEATLVPDKNSNLKPGDTVTFTVTLKAGDIDNRYSASLNGTPMVEIGDTSIPVENIVSSGNDTYTGTVQYTPTSDDVEANSLTAHVKAKFDYRYAFGVSGDDTTQHDLTSTAIVESKSDAIVINGFANAHHVSYEYDYTGPDTHPDSLPALPTDSTKYYPDDTVTISSTPKEGDTVRDDENGGTWTFKGWTLNGSLVGDTVSMGNSDLDFVGEWEFTADADSLTYDANANGGSYSGETPSNDGYTGGLVVVNENGFTRLGYRFLSWNTKSDGTGNTYNAGVDHYRLTTGNDILYAQWVQGHRLSYVYDYAGADGIDASTYPDAITSAPVDTAYYYPTDEAKMSSEPAERTVDDPVNHGTWTFGGWTINGEAAQGTVLMGMSDVTLAGTWTFTPYDQLTYDGNGADSGSVSAAEGPAGTDVTVSANGFSRSGYRFTGWNAKADGTGTPYAAGASYALTDGQDVLYAQWEKVSSGGGTTPAGKTPSSGTKATGGNDPAGKAPTPSAAGGSRSAGSGSAGSSGSAGQSNSGSAVSRSAAPDSAGSTDDGDSESAASEADGDAGTMPATGDRAIPWLAAPVAGIAAAVAAFAARMRRNSRRGKHRA